LHTVANCITMKWIIYITTTLLFSTAAYAQPKVRVEDAPKYAGDTVTVCGRVIVTNYDAAEKDAPTFLEMEGTGNGAPVVVSIRNEYRKNFNYKPEKDLLLRNICVTGFLQSVDGKLVMAIAKQSQVKVLPKDED